MQEDQKKIDEGFTYEGRISPTEKKFKLWRGKIGLFLGPTLFILIFFCPLGLDSAPHKLLSVYALVITYWLTEAIPRSISAILGAVLCVVLGISTHEQVFIQFVNPVVLLFVGGFLLAEAMKSHHLDKRIACIVLSSTWMRNKTSRLLLALGIIPAFISMWISNTATAAMISPIALRILRSLDELDGGVKKPLSKYNTGVMLIVAYAASIGGIATPVGTPVNIIGIGLIRNFLGYNITFFKWMLFGLPIAFISFLVSYFLIRILHPSKMKILENLGKYVLEEKVKLGPLSPGEKNTMIAFFVAVTLWILPGFVTMVFGSNFFDFFSTHFSDGIIALVASCLLFILPTDFKNMRFTLTWEEASKIDWEAILMFGASFALCELMVTTKLADAMGRSLITLFGAKSQWGITAVAIGLGIIISEFTNNTTTALTVIPITIAFSSASKVNPLIPALGACLGASFGFMFPISTPPNEIVYSSGMIPITKMIRAGIILDILGFLIILLSLRVLCPVLDLM